jgi:sigma-E factor negative regulatory protein RseA
MTDPIHEQLSAFHDGELASAESELLLKRLQRDPQLRATVGRYALIGEALRSTEAGGPSRNFATRIAQAIEHESAPTKKWRPIANWLKPIAGGAIAAGVAAVALVSLRITAPGFSGNQAPVETAASEAPVAQPVTEQVAATSKQEEPARLYTVPVNSANRNAPPLQVVNSGRLANFVMAHSEYSSPLGQRNVLTGLLVEDALQDPSDSNQPDSEPNQR